MALINRKSRLRRTMDSEHMASYEFAFSKTSSMKIGELPSQGSSSHSSSSLERKEGGTGVESTTLERSSGRK